MQPSRSGCRESLIENTHCGWPGISGQKILGLPFARSLGSLDRKIKAKVLIYSQRFSQPSPPDLYCHVSIVFQDLTSELQLLFSGKLLEFVARTSEVSLSTSSSTHLFIYSTNSYYVYTLCSRRCSSFENRVMNMRNKVSEFMKLKTYLGRDKHINKEILGSIRCKRQHNRNDHFMPWCGSSVD